MEELTNSILQIEIYISRHQTLVIEKTKIKVFQ